jgi:hypothetical protein
MNQIGWRYSPLSMGVTLIKKLTNTFALGDAVWKHPYWTLSNV